MGKVIGKRLVFVLLTVSILVCPTASPARFIENWPYDRLFKEADLAVFAAAEKNEAADDKPPDHNWPLEVVGQNTTFQVVHILKGNLEEKQFKVLHFKFGEPKKGVRPIQGDIIEIVDGPLFATFRVHPISRQQYLLFLKRLKDGRYEPVSGRIDPALSIREISAPGEARGGGL